MIPIPLLLGMLGMVGALLPLSSPLPQERMPSAAPLIVASSGDQDKGKSLYTVYCASCHGATGKGDGGASANLAPKPKPLQAVLKGKKEAEVLEVIAKGKGQMPGWGHVLTPGQMKEIYLYIKELGRPETP